MDNEELHTEGVIEYAPAPAKRRFRYIAYVAPLIFILIYYILYRVVLPAKYDHMASVAEWAFVWKILFFVLFAGFAVSVYFLGRELHFGKKDYAANAQAVGKDAYFIALDIYEAAKSTSYSNNREVLQSIKHVSDRLKNSTEFGRGNARVTACENEMIDLMNEVRNKISTSGAGQEIITLCRQLMSKIRIREEMLKR